MLCSPRLLSALPVPLQTPCGAPGLVVPGELRGDWVPGAAYVEDQLCHHRVKVLRKGSRPPRRARNNSPMPLRPGFEFAVLASSNLDFSGWAGGGAARESRIFRVVLAQLPLAERGWLEGRPLSATGWLEGQG